MSLHKINLKSAIWVERVYVKSHSLYHGELQEQNAVADVTGIRAVGTSTSKTVRIPHISDFIFVRTTALVGE